MRPASRIGRQLVVAPQVDLQPVEGIVTVGRNGDAPRSEEIGANVFIAPVALEIGANPPPVGGNLDAVPVSSSTESWR
jgi:hypothetical protein